MEQEQRGQTNDILRRVALALERLAPNQQTTQSAIDALLKIGITDSGKKADDSAKGSGSSGGGRGSGGGRDDSSEDGSGGGKGPPKPPDQSATGMLKGLGPSASRLLGAGESLLPGLGLGEIGSTISKMVNLLSAFEGAKDALGRMGMLGDASQTLDPPELPASHRAVPLAPPPLDKGPIHVLPPELPGPLPAGEEKIPLATSGYPLLGDSPPTPTIPTLPPDGKTRLGGPRSPELSGPQAPHTTLAPAAYKDEVSDAGSGAVPLSAWKPTKVEAPPLLSTDDLPPVPLAGGTDASSKGGDDIPMLNPQAPESGMDPAPVPVGGAGGPDSEGGLVPDGDSTATPIVSELKNIGATMKQVEAKTGSKADPQAKTKTHLDKPQSQEASGVNMPIVRSGKTPANAFLEPLEKMASNAADALAKVGGKP